MPEKKNPSKYLVACKNQIEKVQDYHEALRLRKTMEKVAALNYPWERRKAHIYALCQ